MAEMASIYDVAVIGGGVVGCGVARACALAGRKTVLIEREAALASSHASGGNTGIACTAADCEPGTVEHSCLERAAELNLDAYDACNVPYAATGAVYVAYGPQEHAALDHLIDAHGDAADGGEPACAIRRSAGRNWSGCGRARVRNRVSSVLGTREVAC